MSDNHEIYERLHQTHRQFDDADAAFGATEPDDPQYAARSDARAKAKVAYDEAYEVYMSLPHEFDAHRLHARARSAAEHKPKP
jgi:hypothetical protein